MEKILDRFLRYVAVDTQADPESSSQPSAAKELNLLKMLTARPPPQSPPPQPIYVCGETARVRDDDALSAAYTPPHPIIRDSVVRCEKSLRNRLGGSFFFCYLFGQLLTHLDALVFETELRPCRVRLVAHAAGELRTD